MPDPIIELAGSPKESLNEQSGSSAERRFLVAMNARLTFAESLVGTAYPNFPQARIVSLDFQPWMDGDSLPTGDFTDVEAATADYGSQLCLVTAKYGPDYTLKDWPSEFPKPSTIRTGTEVRYQIKGTGEFLLVPTSATKWGSATEEPEDASDSSYVDAEPEASGSDEAPVPEDANTSILVSKRLIQLQWDFVDDPPLSRFDGLLGKVCNDGFLGAPAETLLFENYDVAESFRASATNPHTNRVIINLSQRRIATGTGVVGWNHDYREDPAGWVKLLLSDGQPRYKLAAFSGMFA